MSPDDLAPGRFWLPGPTEVAPEVLAAQSRAVIAHRGDEAEELMRCLQPGLQEILGTRRPVIVLTASATALMEAGVRAGVRRGLLAVVNGAFSARFATIARGCGVDVEPLEVPWGDVVDPQAVRERLATGRFDAVSVVHSETSTGALNPVAEVGAVVRGFDDVHLIVDSVTGAGGVPVDADARGLDLVLTGSQKALAMPPGLAFGAASERLLERAAGLGGRGFYLDLVRIHESLARNQAHTTPALTLMYAAAAQLARIAAEGLEARFARHAAMARRCHTFVEELSSGNGIEVAVLAPRGHRSPTVTCIRLPPGVDGPTVVHRIRECGWVVGAGYGPLKPDTVRIGHMGDHRPEVLDELLAVVRRVLIEEAGG